MKIADIDFKKLSEGSGLCPENLWRMGIIERPLFEQDVSANEVN